MLNRISIIILFSVMITSIGIHAQQTKTVDDLARAFIKQNNVPGMSIAVINHGKTQIYTYGYADERRKKPITNDTIYTIASFTKTITGTLAAVAVTENKLNLADSFFNYFPDVQANNALKTVTVNQLLGHVASLPFDFLPRPQTYEEIVYQLNHFTPKALPGSEYQYSNASIGIVGYVLQNLYGKKYQTLLTEKILYPLQMQSTYLHVPLAKEKFITLGHDKDNHVVQYNRTIEPWFAAASLKSTISDMAKYLAAHMDPQHVDDKHLSKALTLVHQNNYCFTDKKSCEQLAWQAHIMFELNSSNGDSLFTHYDATGFPMFGRQQIIANPEFDKIPYFIDKTCSGYGMSGYMAYIPQKHVGVVILVNKSIGDERIRLGRDILINAS